MIFSKILKVLILFVCLFMFMLMFFFFVVSFCDVRRKFVCVILV
jgi:hypothetical protein